MVTGFLTTQSDQKTAKVNARLPGEPKSGSRRRGQQPVHRIAKMPKLHLRVVLGARWKHKQQDHAAVKENAKKSSAPMESLFSVRFDQSMTTIHDTNQTPLVDPLPEVRLSSGSIRPLERTGHQ
jgi:hypothetical protein